MDEDPELVRGSVAGALFPFRAQERPALEEMANSQEKILEGLVALRHAYAVHMKATLDDMPRDVKKKSMTKLRLRH